jgi:hypothetical protein
MDMPKPVNSCATALREMSSKKLDAVFAEVVAELARMSVAQRAEALVGLFTLVTREFAKLVLEHVDLDQPPPSNAKRVNARRSRRRPRGAA